MTRIAALFCAVVAIAAGAYFIMTPAKPGSTVLDGFVSAASAQSGEEVDTSGIVEMTLGAEDAPLTIIEYASYTCPHCAAFHNGPFKQLKKDYIDTGKVKFVYREVYFDKYGLWASMIARCGGEPKFFGITDLIFKGQSEWVRAGGEAQIADELRKIARLAGIDNADLDACMNDSEKAQTLVAWFQKNAAADDVTATPSFVIDGEPVENQSYDKLKAIIDGKLAEG